MPEARFSLLMILVQDNAGKTTLLYRLKVREPLDSQLEPEVTLADTQRR